MTSGHRIRLRGPWTLNVEGSLATASRTFHAPTGIERSARVELGWQTPRNALIVELRLNERSIKAEEIGESELDRPSAIQRFEVGGILKAFNTLVLVWNLPDNSIGLESGKHTPDPHHPLHLDTWLEIFEE